MKATQSTVGHDDKNGGKMQAQAFSNVFDALANTPDEAATMKARSELLSALKARVSAWNLRHRRWLRIGWGLRDHALMICCREKWGNSRSMPW
jgi:alpha-D-ribose 1-methylphosphonate 5-triphosphate synthase subunit PhnG